MIDLIKERLRRYAAVNPLEEENAVKEILQEIALYALWRGDFFDVGQSGGGFGADGIGHGSISLLWPGAGGSGNDRPAVRGRCGRMNGDG